MAQKYDFDLIVIGAGIAGLVSSVTANGLGKKVALIEKRKFGGNCTNLTCIPSKSLIRMGHYAHDLTRLEKLGILASTADCIDKTKIMSHVRSIVQKSYEKDVPETFERIGIEIIDGLAEFLDPHTIQVGSKRISAEKFILSVGTIPLVPNIPGLHDIDYLTNENVFDLHDLPKSLIILGGGVDGLEYASAFGRLGVQTTVVEMAPRLLPAVDAEIANHLAQEFTSDGIQLLTSSKAVAFSSENGSVSLEIEQPDGTHDVIRAERVLVTIGRKPDLEELNLDKAGVRYGPKGIVTNNTLQTTATNIYACGDVAGPDLLASTAEYQGITAATNAVSPVKSKVDYSNNVYVIFTEPTIAQIGLTEYEALKKYGTKLKVYRFDYSTMRRAIIDGTTSGLAKILTDGRGRIVGAHILGEAAAEVIHEIQIIKALKKPLHKLNMVTHAYPTYSQALVGRASQLAFLEKMGGSFWVNLALKAYPGLSNKLDTARDRLAEKDEPGAEQMITNTQQSQGDSSPLPTPAGKRRKGNAVIIELPEALMYHSETPFLAEIFEGAGEHPNVALDFSGMRRINGLGAGMLLKLYIALKRRNVELTAFGIPKGLREIFKVTELEQVISLHETEQEALAGLGNHAPDETDGAIQAAEIQNIDAWAKPYPMLTLPDMPKEARNLNVSGRAARGPVNGFGQFWQKIYKLEIPDPSISPETAVKALKENFPEFQPTFNKFYAGPHGIAPGEIVLIDSMTPGGPVSTGVMIMYADDLSFTFNTPVGHPESGWVSFSASRRDGLTVVEITGLARANDPMYEVAFQAVGSNIQIKIWSHVLQSLAAYLGVSPKITHEAVCIDPNYQWDQARNLFYNAQIRTLLQEPLRWFRRV